MALTRKALKAMGLADEQVESIIEMHTETTDGLKADLSRYKEDAEKLPAVQKELDELKAAGDGGYKEKYEKEHKAFEDFKTQTNAEKTRGAKEKAYRELLKDCGVTEKRIDAIMKVFIHDSIELDENGKIKDSEKVSENIKSEWSDFIVTTTTTGANTATPPRNIGTGKTKEEIMAIKDGIERRKAMAENPHLFGLAAN